MISLPKPLSTMVDIDQIPEVNQVYASALNGIDKILKDAKSGKALQRIRGDIGEISYSDRRVASFALDRAVDIIKEENLKLQENIDNDIYDAEHLRIVRHAIDWGDREIGTLCRVILVLRGWA